MRRICYFQNENDRKNYNLLFTISDFKWNLILFMKWDPNKNENEFIYNLQFTRCRRHQLSSPLDLNWGKNTTNNGTINACASHFSIFSVPWSQNEMTISFLETGKFSKLSFLPFPKTSRISSSTYDIDRIPILTVPGVTQPTMPLNEWNGNGREKQFGRSERVTFWIYSYCFFLPSNSSLALISISTSRTPLPPPLLYSVWIITWNYTVESKREEQNQDESKMKENISPSSTQHNHCLGFLLLCCLPLAGLAHSTCIERARHSMEWEWKSH